MTNGPIARRPTKTGSTTTADDRGSTIPLILGFFLIAMIMIAGSVAAGDAFVQQRGLQDMCDGAAVAAAASGVDLGRSGDLDTERALHFGDVQATVTDYLARDPSRRSVHVNAQLSADAQTLTLTCEQLEKVAFGAMFGRGAGLRHTVTSSAHAPLS